MQSRHKSGASGRVGHRPVCPHDGCRRIKVNRVKYRLASTTLMEKGFPLIPEEHLQSRVPAILSADSLADQKGLFTKRRERIGFRAVRGTGRNFCLPARSASKGSIAPRGASASPMEHS